jgi:hypothetical protein
LDFQRVISFVNEEGGGRYPLTAGAEKICAKGGKWCRTERKRLLKGDL